MKKYKWIVENKCNLKFLKLFLWGLSFNIKINEMILF